MAQRFVFTDGKNTKTMSVWDNPAAWNSLLSSPEVELDNNATSFYFGKVPWLFRGVNLIASTIASVPFIVQKGGKDIDLSDDYKNKVDFLPNPRRLFWLIAASRTLTGKAYLFQERKVGYKGVSLLRHLNPTSVDEVYGDESGNVFLKGFSREVSTGKGRKEKREYTLEDIAYLWQGDPYVELGPPLNYPAKAALAAAGVLWNIDEFVRSFIQRGAVKATLFGVPATTVENERNRLQRWLDKYLSGVRNAGNNFVVNADEIKLTTIGEGLEGLKDSDLTPKKREDICQALGIPMSKLFSNDAGGMGGGGVVQQDDERFWRETILPEVGEIFADLNTQVFEPSGFRILINEKAIDVFQEDETMRSTSLVNLTNAISTSPQAAMFAMNLLGYELTDEDKALLAAIDPVDDEPEPEPERMDAPPDPEREAEQRQQREEAGGSKAVTDEMLKELGQWERHAKRIGGERSAKEFEPEYLPDSVTEYIAEGLVDAVSKDAIKSVFTQARDILTRPDAEQVLVLVEAIQMGLAELRSEPLQSRL